MRSDKKLNKLENSENTKNAEVNSSGDIAKKLTFGLKIFPDTMEMVNTLYEHDNCSSRSEFIEKAVRFYCGYLLNKESCATEFIAPQLASILEGIVIGRDYTAAEITELLSKGRVTLKNCISSKGNKYSAVFSLEDTGKYVNLKFEEFVGGKKKKSE